MPSKFRIIFVPPRPQAASAMRAACRLLTRHFRQRHALPHRQQPADIHEAPSLDAGQPRASAGFTPPRTPPPVADIHRVDRFKPARRRRLPFMLYEVAMSYCLSALATCRRQRHDAGQPRWSPNGRARATLAFVIYIFSRFPSRRRCFSHFAAAPSAAIFEIQYKVSFARLVLASLRVIPWTRALVLGRPASPYQQAGQACSLRAFPRSFYFEPPSGVLDGFYIVSARSPSDEILVIYTRFADARSFFSSI